MDDRTINAEFRDLRAQLDALRDLLGQIPVRQASGDSGGGGGGTFRARIKAIANNYLTVVAYPGGVETGAQFPVAKNFKLRHVLANFPGLTSLTSVNAQTVTVSDGTNSATWITIPSYNVNDEIRVEAVGDGTGVAQAPAYADANRDGRAWRRQ